MAANVIIETHRQILRTVTIDDIENISCSWKLDEGNFSLEEAIKKIDWMQSNHTQNRPGNLVHLCLAIIGKESQSWVGWCGLDHRDHSQKNPVLFYLLKQRYWGKGLATEAAQALIRYAFDELGLDQIDSGAAQENIASKRVMEKIPMRYLGLSDSGGYSFTITRDEFQHAASYR